MSALPATPAGANPFAIYLDALEAQLYPSGGAHGFAARAYVLLAVCAYGIVISVAYGAALLWRSRRRGKPLWVARKVDGYLTLNLAFFVPAGGAVCCAFMLAYTYLQYRLFTLPSHPSSSLYPTNAFRPYCWIPLVLHGYSVAAASAQACLVVSHRTSAFSKRRNSLLSSSMDWSRLAKPAVVNAIFWMGLLFFLLVLLIPDILFSISWSRTYSKIASLESYLVQQTSNPSAGVLQLVHLGELFEAMKAAAAHTCQHQQAVVAALIFAPVFLALITSLATFLLCRLLRQQIRSRSVRRSISSNRNDRDKPARGSDSSSFVHPRLRRTLVVVREGRQASSAKSTQYQSTTKQPLFRHPSSHPDFGSTRLKGPRVVRQHRLNPWAEDAACGGCRGRCWVPAGCCGEPCGGSRGRDARRAEAGEAGLADLRDRRPATHSLARRRELLERRLHRSYALSRPELGFRRSGLLPAALAVRDHILRRTYPPPRQHPRHLGCVALLAYYFFVDTDTA